MDEFDKPELSLKEERLKEKVQNDIHYCLNCQARDSGEWIWILGERYDLEDLFDDYNVDENIRDKITEHLNCPYCGTELNRYDEIGLEDRFDKEIQSHINVATKKYSKKIKKLSEEICEFPTLAIGLPLGKSIFNEIKNSKLPECSIEGTFYRARKLNDSTILENKEFLSPPIGKSEEGRFNHSGQSHFYISKKKDTAIFECLGSKQSSLIWVQKFELLKITKILDLEYVWEKLGPSTSTLLVALHQSSILKKSDKNNNKWRPDYNLTRFIMDCAKKNGYNGIKYNSTKDITGINIVLFNLDKKSISKVEKPEVIIHNPVTEDKQYEDLFNFIK